MSNDEEVAKLEKTRQWASEYYGIPANDVLGYNNGTCYDSIWVQTRESAEKVKAKVAGEFVNGGMFDGMPLGRIEESKDGTFSLMC